MHIQSNRSRRNKSISGTILLFFIFILCSCSEKVSVDEQKEKTDFSGERIIRITFKFPGDEIGAPEHQIILHKIITSIKSKEAGDIMGSGFGMGTMEINLKVEGEESIKKIKGIITDTYPTANYSMTSNEQLPR